MDFKRVFDTGDGVPHGSFRTIIILTTIVMIILMTNLILMMIL